MVTKTTSKPATPDLDQQRREAAAEVKAAQEAIDAPRKRLVEAQHRLARLEDERRRRPAVPPPPVSPELQKLREDVGGEIATMDRSRQSEWHKAGGIDLLKTCELDDAIRLLERVQRHIAGRFTGDVADTRINLDLARKLLRDLDGKIQQACGAVFAQRMAARDATVQHKRLDALKAIRVGVADAAVATDAADRLKELRTRMEKLP